MPTLLSLETMGRHWYAAYRDGNAILRRPTIYSSKLPRADVIAAIEKAPPEIRIDDKARRGDDQ